MLNNGTGFGFALNVDKSLNKINVPTFAADSVEELQMVHSHLKDLRFLQLRGALFHQAA